jgi:hypothetical protein
MYNARATLPEEMADTTGKIAKNLERFAQAVAAHDRENPTHTANGIGLAHFDLERLGLEEGEEILPGITIHADSGVTGNFRVLCDGEHDEGKTEAEEEVVEAVSTQAVPAIAPGVSTEEIPFGTADLRVARVEGADERGARSGLGGENRRFRPQA